MKKSRCSWKPSGIKPVLRDFFKIKQNIQWRRDWINMYILQHTVNTRNFPPYCIKWRNSLGFEDPILRLWLSPIKKPFWKSHWFHRWIHGKACHMRDTKPLLSGENNLLDLIRFLSFSLCVPMNYSEHFLQGVIEGARSFRHWSGENSRLWSGRQWGNEAFVSSSWVSVSVFILWNLTVQAQYTLLRADIALK